ncbi:MarR family winged helix-turn-helix transcriptional regulator [Streptomyces sp. NPDC048057]|uniref:MarR family winged helix-turn-helix transcriptional regulator n=1 Tax=Streptomyces sp. NPDC048057 TaxID=3155628 RepID=UPI0034074CEC
MVCSISGSRRSGPVTASESLPSGRAWWTTKPGSRISLICKCVSLLALDPGPRTTGEIADLTGLTSGSATRLVDRLQKAGLAERHSDPHDRRKTLVTLTSDRTPEIEAAWEPPARPSTRHWRTSPTTNSPSSSDTCGAPPTSAPHRPHTCAPPRGARHRLPVLRLADTCSS